MQVRAKDITMVPISEIKPSPRNNNKHTDEQLMRLEKIMRHQGFRSPLVVSNQSGNLVAGHLRLQAAKNLGFAEVPVSFQDFETDADEYSHMTADNALAAWSELDLAGINAILPDFGPELDLELLGLKNFSVDASDKDRIGATELNPGEFDVFAHTCPRCGFEFDSSKNEEGDAPSAAST